jgi:hypothetical protein
MVVGDEPGDAADDAGAQADDGADAARPVHDEGPGLAGLGSVVGHWSRRADFQLRYAFFEELQRLVDGWSEWGVA